MIMITVECLNENGTNKRDSIIIVNGFKRLNKPKWHFVKIQNIRENWRTETLIWGYETFRDLTDQLKNKDLI